jgi:hypothetical protein
MEQFIGCDAHKKFSLFIAMNEEGEYGRAILPHFSSRRAPQVRHRISPFAPAGST